MTLRTSAVGLALAALVLFSAGDAAAEETAEDDRSVLALAAGGAITFASLGVGSTIIAVSEDRRVRNPALLGGQWGMVFAPLAAHAIVGETRRGVWFSLPLLVPVVVNSIVVRLYPDVIRRAPAGVQYTTFLSVTLSVFGSTYGVLDALRSGERRPKKSSGSSFAVLPMFGEGTAGALVTGSL